MYKSFPMEKFRKNDLNNPTTQRHGTSFNSLKNKSTRQQEFNCFPLFFAYRTAIVEADKSLKSAEPLKVIQDDLGSSAQGLESAFSKSLDNLQESVMRCVKKYARG
jgi:hypothetical protein